MLKLASRVILLTFLFFSSEGRGQTTIANGHVDIFGVGYVAEDPGAFDFEFLIHDEDSGAELEPSSTVLQINATGLQSVPTAPEFSFLGTPGSSVYILPKFEEEADSSGVIFAGVGTEEILPADWGLGGSAIAIELTGVLSVPLGGKFVLWDEDIFGDPNPLISSSDLTNYPSITVPIDNHSHYYWGFTEPGSYELAFAASGTPAGGSLQSATQTYTFQVVPEPSTFALLGLGALALATLRLRRSSAQRRLPKNAVPSLQI